MCGDLNFEYRIKICFQKIRQRNSVSSRDLGYQALVWGIRAKNTAETLYEVILLIQVSSHDFEPKYLYYIGSDL